MKDNTLKTKKIVILAMMLAVAVVLGYVEYLIPFNFGVPGIKLGLANIVTIILLTADNKKSAYLVGVLRILIVGFLFSNLSMILYSGAGLVLSISVMILAMSFKRLSVVGVSVVGAVFHNIGQLIVAVLVVRSIPIFYYAPVLVIAGVITGICTGSVALVINRLFRRELEK